MKMLKLLLTSSAYANIIQVSQQKQSSPEEQSRAVTLQNTVLTTAEYKTKSTATLLAKQHYQKVFHVVVVNLLHYGEVNVWILPCSLHQ